jgi:hypothetical protein
VGLHGGFYSLQSGLIEKEVKKLSIRTQSPIFSGRQHWLNLPDREQAFTSIRSSGLANDSTLGWNGVVGFRGGFSRPFYLQAGEKAYVREVPMLLMDGALFDDLRLNRQEAVSVAKKHLSEVKSRGGCAALNWHDRSASPHYGWAPAYEEIINWAFNEGFAFATVNQAANEFLPRVEAEQ